MIRGYKSLKVYQMAFQAAKDIFELTKKFPVEEKYSMTDQIRRSSRSVCICIGEGYRKRKYPKYFSLKMTDADGEATETTIWLDLAFASKYIASHEHSNLVNTYDEIGKMLNSMADNPDRFLPRKQ
ncbi:MAG: four helix bundle protein [Tangfeifania sp.]